MYEVSLRLKRKDGGVISPEDMRKLGQAIEAAGLKVVKRTNHYSEVASSTAISINPYD